MITVGHTAKKGRGVFATEKIPKGRTIEKAPVIVIPDDRENSAGRCILDDYFFEWEGDLAIALGFGSLYNHSYAPNATFICRHEALSIEFVALRDIPPGEEITIDYNERSDYLSSLWFKPEP